MEKSRGNRNRLGKKKKGRTCKQHRHVGGGGKKKKVDLLVDEYCVGVMGKGHSFASATKLDHYSNDIYQGYKPTKTYFEEIPSMTSVEDNFPVLQPSCHIEEQFVDLTSSMNNPTAPSSPSESVHQETKPKLTWVMVCTGEKSIGEVKAQQSHSNGKEKNVDGEPQPQLEKEEQQHDEEQEEDEWDVVDVKEVIEPATSNGAESMSFMKTIFGFNLL